MTVLPWTASEGVFAYEVHSSGSWLTVAFRGALEGYDGREACRHALRILFDGDTQGVVRRLELRDLNDADQINLAYLAAALRVRQASGRALELGLPIADVATKIMKFMVALGVRFGGQTDNGRWLLLL